LFITERLLYKLAHNKFEQLKNIKYTYGRHYKPQLTQLFFDQKILPNHMTKKQQLIIGILAILLFTVLLNLPNLKTNEWIDSTILNSKNKTSSQNKTVKTKFSKKKADQAVRNQLKDIEIEYSNGKMTEAEYLERKQIAEVLLLTDVEFAELQVKKLLEKNPNATEEEITEEFRSAMGARAAINEYNKKFYSVPIDSEE
jgi:hypothetical protein